MKRKGFSTPFILVVVSILISGAILSLETDMLLGLQDEAIEGTLPLVAQRIEAVLISVEGMENIEVEMNMQREFWLSVQEGKPAIRYNEAQALIKPGMNFQVQEGNSSKFCITQKPEKTVKIAAKGC